MLGILPGHLEIWIQLQGVWEMIDCKPSASILRYLGFIVTDSILLLSTPSHAFGGCTVNHLPDTLWLYPTLWVAQ